MKEKIRKKVALHNLGCKVNAYETEAMQEILEQAEYEIVPFKEGADIYIINTCTVTNIADRKSRQMLHRARKLNPDAIVVAAGCYVQAQEEQQQKIDSCIDIVIGNNKKQDLLSILRAYGQTQKTGEGTSCSKGCSKQLIAINQTKEYESLQLSRTGEHTRAYIKVQDGCNQFCSYCIIPFARGRVRSRKMEDVVNEVRRLSSNGYQEIVLTGIHLSSYGVDFEQEQNLLQLICAVHEVEGIQRIRLGSLEPRIITEEFVRTIARLPKMCPHFHLSLQSGCDGTLARMNRRYTSGEYYEKCELLRRYFDNPALTTDIIVGFPGETQEEFEKSKAFVDGVNFYETHIFKYSKREGTKAAVMENQVPEQEKGKRSEQMLALNGKKKKEFEKTFIGKTVEVLIEEETVVNGKKVQVGHSKEYMKIALDTAEKLENCIINIQIDNDLQIIH